MTNEEEKQRKEICETMRRLYERKLISSVGGNASVILRKKNTVLITPSGSNKKELVSKEIVKVNINGIVLDKGKPSSETINHIGIYKTRTDINAIVHAHPPFFTGIASSGYTLKAITPEQILLANNITVIDFVVPGKDSVVSLTKALEKNNVVIIKNHGVFSIGKDLMECFVRIEILEEVGKMVFAGKLFGGMNELSQENVKNVLNKYNK
jgi:L-fuculose-phosphate aldolase